MNSDTGQMYFENRAIREAMMRGEPLVDLNRSNIDGVIGDARRERESALREAIGDADGPTVPVNRAERRRRMRGQRRWRK